MISNVIGEFFEEHKDIIPSKMSDGKILRINFKENEKQAEFVVALGNFVDYETVKQFEKRLCKAYGLKDFQSAVSMRLMCFLFRFLRKSLSLSRTKILLSMVFLTGQTAFMKTAN
ncbi:MAG: hypothetical protein IJ401_07910 [Oscillospiraceae bacterium]|nr:hypothetical protein [Oscillospiraceae bacterium]